MPESNKSVLFAAVFAVIFVALAVVVWEGFMVWQLLFGIQKDYDKISVVTATTKKQADDDTFLLVVDYDQTLTGLIEMGDYGSARSDQLTEKNFPSKGGEVGKKKLLFKIFHSDGFVKGEDVIVRMENDGYRPASLKELLAVGAAKKDLPPRLVALGSVWFVFERNNPRVPVIQGNDLGKGDFRSVFPINAEFGY